MKRYKRIICIIFISSLITIILITGCSPMSETITDQSAGMNSSFEYVKNGLPVNWLVYTPNTVRTADFDIIIDTTEHHDGKQCLKYIVRKCLNTGGRFSPGLSNEYEAKPGETYKVSFWAKNKDSEFFAQVGGVNALQGDYKTMVKSKESFDDWKQFEYIYTIPQKMNAIRFEINILQPGSFWIDDIIIEKIKSI